MDPYENEDSVTLLSLGQCSEAPAGWLQDTQKLPYSALKLTVLTDAFVM